MSRCALSNLVRPSSSVDSLLHIVSIQTYTSEYIFLSLILRFLLMLSCSTCCDPSVEKHADLLTGRSSYRQSLLLCSCPTCIIKIVFCFVLLMQTGKVFPTGFFAAIRYYNVFFSLLTYPLPDCNIIVLLCC